MNLSTWFATMNESLDNVVLLMTNRGVDLYVNEDSKIFVGVKLSWF
jgi:hypothetical protein